MSASRTPTHWTKATEFDDEYFKMMAELEDSHPWTRSMRRLMLELLRKTAPTTVHKILDVGCGTGLFLADLESVVRAGAAVGMDLFPAALRYAREQSHASWLVGSAANLPFSPGSLDIIHCADVLQHLTLEEAQCALDAFSSTLRPGGILALRLRAGHLFEALPQIDYSQHFSPAFLKRALRSRSLRPLFVSHVNALPSLWAEVQEHLGISRRQKAVKGISTEAAKRRSSFLLGAYLRLERGWLLKTGFSMPIGHTIVCVAQKA